MVIQRSPVETRDEGVQLLARLSRHLNAVEKAEVGAGDDLAAVLRILLDKTDRGNRGIERLAAAVNAKPPAVWCSGGPTLPTSKGLLLSFGNVPDIQAPGDGGRHTGRLLSWDGWVNAYSLVIPTSQKKRLSWGEFATLVANTSGAHLSTIYHDFLEASDLFDSVGLSLQDYLLRQIGWQVEKTLESMLTSADRPVFPRLRKLNAWPRMPVWGQFRERDGVLEAEVSINVTSDVVQPIEVMRFKWRDRTTRVFHDGGLPPVVRMIVDNPATGEQLSGVATPLDKSPVGD